MIFWCNTVYAIHPANIVQVKPSYQQNVKGNCKLKSLSYRRFLVGPSGIYSWSTYTVLGGGRENNIKSLLVMLAND